MSKITDRFRDITGVDIAAFMSGFVSFVDTNYRDVVAYYNGQDIDKDAFNKLDALKSSSQAIAARIEQCADMLEGAEFWELIDKFSNIQTQLDTIDNLGRWLRSSRTDRYDDSVKIDYITRQLETLENLSRKSGDLSPDDDWSSIAISNDIQEEDYTSAGGVLLHMKFNNAQSFDIKNIVDTLKADNLYGKDIQKRFEISNGDLVTLSGNDAIKQTFETIFESIKGGIPEFPEDGVSPDIIGQNVNAFNYPSIFRCLVDMFKKDDRFSSVDLVDLYRDGDGVFMKVSAKTKIGDLLLKEIAL
jgi:hypothetical protein